MAIKYLDSKRIRGSSTGVGANVTHSQTSQNTQEALGHTNHLKAAQRIQAGHALIGKTVTTCTFYMSGSVSSGTTICELLESDGTLKAEIGTTNNSTISSSAGAVTFTGGAGGEVEADDMLALRTTGTDNSNYFALYHHTSSQEANSHWVDYQSGSWSNQTSKDLYFTATYASTVDDKTVVSIAGVDGSWSAGGALASDVTEPASGGNSTDAIVMGGYTGSNSGITTTQEYDGSSWSAGGNLTAPGGSTCGGGTSSDAIIMTAKHSGANVADFCQEYDGTSWSDGGNPNTDRHNAAGDGNSSDAICVGGSPSASETYNGSSWTDIAEVTGRENFAAGGTSSSAICMGATITTETWNGSAWSAGGNMTQANGGNEGGGLPTDAITIGGTTDNDMVEKYNGTAWAAVDLLTTGRGNHAGKGNNLNAFCAGGGSTSTEERTSTPDVIPATYLPENTIYEETDTRKVYFLQSQEWVEAAYTGPYGAMYCGGGGDGGGSENAWDLAYVSAGAAGGSWTQVTDMSNEIWAGCGGGGKSNMILMGGHDDRSGDSGELNTAYKWNGTVWSSLTNMDRNRNGGKGGGSASDAMTCGGRAGGYTNTCVEWNGSSWSAGGGMGRIRFKGGADGSTTDGICGGGYSTSNALTNVSETYNGSTWSNSGNLGGAWYVNGIVGGSADALEVGHYQYVNDCYKFNGSSWSSTTALNASVGAVGAAGGDGTSSSASSSSIQIGGMNSANSGVGKSSEIFDGTAWTTKDDAPYNSQEPFVGVTDL